MDSEQSQNDYAGCYADIFGGSEKNQTTYISLLQDFKRLLRLVGHELIHVKLIKNKF